MVRLRPVAKGGEMGASNVRVEEVFEGSRFFARGNLLESLNLTSIRKGFGLAVGQEVFAI